MPIYEFRCGACGRRSSVLVKGFDSPLIPTCPSCGGGEMTRCISTFAFHKSEKSRLEEAGEPEMFPTSPDYYKDPRNIGRWAEKRVQELGMEMPPQAQEMIQAAREGELPDPIKDL